MLVTKDLTETFEEAINTFKRAIADSETICYDAMLITNSASAHILNLSKRIRARAERGEVPEELILQVINYVKQKYQRVIAGYVNDVLIHYYYLLRAAKTVGKNIAIRVQKQDLERLQDEIDGFENRRTNMNWYMQELLADIKRRNRSGLTPEECIRIADAIEIELNLRRSETMPTLKEEMDGIGDLIKKQVQLRFKELAFLSECLLNTAKTIQESSL